MLTLLRNCGFLFFDVAVADDLLLEDARCKLLQLLKINSRQIVDVNLFMKVRNIKTIRTNFLNLHKFYAFH